MDRRVVRLTGKDALTFLQGLVSNDVLPLAKGPGLVWTALLTPQGKYLADFFVAANGTDLLLDLPEAMADSTLARLAMYRLRADVQFEPTGLPVSRGVGTPPEGALMDPRHPDLGWRLYAPCPAETVDWDAVRVRNLIPESGIELIPNESYLLETGFERLHGVDFRKGCYVGQEVTARMKHKTELRKGLARVALSEAVPVGTPVQAGDRDVGAVYTQSGGEAIAWLRFDRTDGPMNAGPAVVTLL
ncbi:MAG: folate-binding protein YgfZ [Pseudorhodobacter sp.]|nr:folate-binding protein YgfZ [Pseudorhodobacter sp.]